MRSAQKLALEIVRPAVNRTDDIGDIPAALQHDRLPVAADVRDEIDAVCVANQGLRVVAPLECVIVARIRHHQLMTDVTGSAREQQALLGVENCRIAIPGSGKLRGGQLQRGAPQMLRRSEIRHRQFLSSGFR